MNFYVVDDHPMMRDAVSMVLRRLRPGVNVVELDRLGGLWAAVEKQGPPDLVCLDLRLPDTNGCSGVRELRQHFPSVPLAVYSASPADDFEHECMEAGADIYIEKATGSAELTAALRGLLMADLTPEAEAEALAHERSADNMRLTRRQAQLISMIERGMGNREIAQELEISEHTVKVHLWRLFRKFGVKSRTQAIHAARVSGLIPI